MFSDSAVNPLLAMHHPEDTFIDCMALGKLVVTAGDGSIKAGSIEGLVARIIKVCEDFTSKTFKKLWVNPCESRNYFLAFNRCEMRPLGKFFCSTEDKVMKRLE